MYIDIINFAKIITTYRTRYFQMQQMIIMQIPLGTMGEPEDIAETASFLLSTRSKYISGTVIDVAGGLLQAILVVRHKIIRDIENGDVKISQNMIRDMSVPTESMQSQ